MVYIAIINGAESAGSLLSFGPSQYPNNFTLLRLLPTDIAIDMAQASAAANRILSFRAPVGRTIKLASKLQNTEGGVKIQLKDAWFKYPTRDVPIFTGLNITVSPRLSHTLLMKMLTTIRLKRANSLPWLDPQDAGKHRLVSYCYFVLKVLIVRY